MRKPEESPPPPIAMHKPSAKMRKILLRDLNAVLICTLCNGYLIDATTLVDCNHVFCRGCILRHFENGKTECPSCKTLYKKKSQTIFRADPQIQSIVYKLVPSLYSKEMQRREDFYRSTGVRASSSCSDDSVLERERDLINDEEALVSSYVGDKTQFFGPEDSISLSLEYYQLHLDTTQDSKKSESGTGSDAEIKLNGSKGGKSECNGVQEADKRFLQCPAGVTMKHLQKFIRMKYALTADHRVDVIHKGEVLPPYYSLMDVAYIFKWKRAKPLRFFYRIFTPLKIQPIKIVNTTLSTGGKQLQIVPVKSEAAPPPPPPPAPKFDEESEEKERLLANLQLQSKTKVPENKPQVQQDCVFDYEEVDKEEIKRFAEIRDREWAMQKRLDESREKERVKDDDYHHFSKKRKKNKHSKNDCVYKKRKLHAEITNKEEELKLKVKLTQHNGHKHKHHKSSASSSTTLPVPSVATDNQMSSKEKLLQMRQVRHKHVPSEDKNIQTLPPIPKEISTETAKKSDEIQNTTPKPKMEEKTNNNNTPKTLRSDFPTKTTLNKEWSTRVPTVQIERHEQTEQQAKKTFFKTLQSFEKPKPQIRAPSQLERKIANLQQRCTIEAKSQPQQEKLSIKPIQSYPPGFTVSKIESGVKRKSDDEKEQPKRPSLEITLINPPEVKPQVKRPPPATIPLERIKKSMQMSKMLNKCDNIGALDLSAKPIKGGGSSSSSEDVANKTPNGFSSVVNNNNNKDSPTSKVNISNLQMLSKVATEINKSPSVSKPRPQIPNLQTLKIPSLLQANMRIPNLDKLPKLTEINKAQFRLPNTQIRNLRPNQNQNIRNIPNPSLLVRQQNQNRLNSMNSSVRENNNAASGGERKDVVASLNSGAAQDAQKAAPQEVKSGDAKEISV